MLLFRRVYISAGHFKKNQQKICLVINPFDTSTVKTAD